jgi:hypothetical protein
MIQTTQQVLHNGARHAVIQVTGVSDGSGNEKNVVKIHLADLGAKSIGIRKITYNVGYGLVKLAWDALVPVDFATLGDGNDVIDYSRISSLKNGGGKGATGDILLSTVGFELASSYMLTIDVVKKS